MRPPAQALTTSVRPSSTHFFFVPDAQCIIVAKILLRKILAAFVVVRVVRKPAPLVFRGPHHRTAQAQFVTVAEGKCAILGFNYSSASSFVDDVAIPSSARCSACGNRVALADVSGVWIAHIDFRASSLTDVPAAPAIPRLPEIPLSRFVCCRVLSLPISSINRHHVAQLPRARKRLFLVIAVPCVSA